MGRSGVIHSRGFTLIELLITLVIVVILVGIGVPSYRAFIQEQRARTAASSLHSALILARSEAVKRNTPVTLSATGGDWNTGWSIASPVAGEPAILVQGALPGITITSAATTIGFSRSGRSTANNFQLVADDNATTVRCLRLDTGGRVASSKGGC